MPKVSEEHLLARRRQILDAAVACFARLGLHRTGMREICREAGISSGAVYSYFRSKREIIEAIADERHAREAEVLALARGAGASDGLRVIVREMFTSLADPAERVRRRANVQTWAESVFDPALRRLLMRGIQPPRLEMIRLIEGAQQRGELPARIDPDGLARALLALFQGFILQQAWDETVAIDTYLETVEAVLDALRAQAVAERTEA